MMCKSVHHWLNFCPFVCQDEIPFLSLKDPTQNIFSPTFLKKSTKGSTLIPCPSPIERAVSTIICMSQGEIQIFSCLFVSKRTSSNTFSTLIKIPKREPSDPLSIPPSAAQWAQSFVCQASLHTSGPSSLYWVLFCRQFLTHFWFCVCVCICMCIRIYAWVFILDPC